MRRHVGRYVAWTSALLASETLGKTQWEKLLPSHPGCKAQPSPSLRLPTSGRIGAEKRPLPTRQPRTSQTITTPTKAETMPAMRKGPSGISRTVAIVALGAGRERRQKNTLDRKQQAERGKKIRHRPDLLRPRRLTQSLLFRGAVRVRGRRRRSDEPSGQRPACRQAAPCRTDRRNSGRNPNPAAAPDGCRPSACSVRKPAWSGRRRRNPDPGRRLRRRSGCASASPSPRICSDC